MHKNEKINCNMQIERLDKAAFYLNLTVKGVINEKTQDKLLVTLVQYSTLYIVLVCVCMCVLALPMTWRHERTHSGLS